MSAKSIVPKFTDIANVCGGGGVVGFTCVYTDLEICGNKDGGGVLKSTGVVEMLGGAVCRTMLQHRAVCVCVCDDVNQGSDMEQYAHIWRNT